jgi:hypothetical protein
VLEEDWRVSGYLLFREGSEGNVKEDGDEDGLIKRDENDGDEKTKFERAVEWLREEFEIEKTGRSGMQNIPVFMGYGVEDEKVKTGFGRAAKEFLKDFGVEVKWREYEGLGLWYIADMLNDVVGFLKGLEGWGDEDTVEDPRRKRLKLLGLRRWTLVAALFGHMKTRTGCEENEAEVIGTEVLGCGCGTVQGLLTYSRHRVPVNFAAECDTITQQPKRSSHGTLSLTRGRFS